MRLQLSSALLVLQAVAAAPSRSSSYRARADADADPKVADTVPVIKDSYIIEVARPSLETAVAKLKAAGVSVQRTFDSDIFSGLAVASTTHNADELSMIAGSSVLGAWPQTHLKLIKPVKAQLVDASASARQPGPINIHKYTGVQKAHDAGFKGKGAVVGVVDSGVDWSHPALGGGYGPGFKVAGGYDLVGDMDWNPNLGDAGKMPDDDPMDHNGHGTHVSGIIAASGGEMTGVAPEATLKVYKVMSGESGSTDEATVIDAFLRAFNDGVDIITASIGGGATAGYASNPWAVVASRMVEQGVLVTIAAGNDGIYGPLWNSDGSMGTEVLAVASAETMELPGDPFEATFYDASGAAVNTTTFAYAHASEPWLDVAGQELYVLDESFDLCNSLPESVPDLSPYIVMFALSKKCSSYDQGYNVYMQGGMRMLAYENGFGFEGSDQLAVEIAEIENDAAEAIKAVVKAGGKVKVDMSKFPSHKFGMYNSAGGAPSYFTTWGPSYELDLKPDVAAPGGEIYSTFLDHGYMVYSGTSMATPYVAGIAALYVSKFGGRSVHGPDFAKMLARRIVASCGTMVWARDSPFWASPAQVGNGMVDAWKVLSYDTGLSFEKMRLNDTSHFNRYHDLTVTNNGKSAVTYKFAHQPAGAFNLMQPYEGYQMIGSDSAPSVLDANVTLPKDFTLQPGQTKKVTVSFKAGEVVNELSKPIFGGKILISGSNAEQLSIPYLGAAFDVKKSFRGNTLYGDSPLTYTGVNDDEISKWNNKTTKFDFDISYATNNFPKIHDQLVWGADEWRWDIFEAGWKERDWKYPPVIGENGYVGSVAFSTYSRKSHLHFDPLYEDPEDTISFPLRGLSRSPGWYPFWWLGKMANGTYITPGKYQMRFAVSVPFSNKQHSDNWDIREFPEIEVLPLKRPIPAR